MNNHTIVALATPQGLGAIGVVRLSGDDALRIAQAIFAGKNLLTAASHSAHFGRITQPSGEVIDEVVATVFVAPRSYTKQNTVEFSCHNSPYILEQIINLCLQQGAVMATAGEFTLRAFLNGGLDLSQAEAVADLIASHSAASHRLAMQQMRGGISSELDVLREKLIHFASLIELELDFGEEDVTFANRTDLQALIQEILDKINALIQSFALGNALKNGVPTAILGKPNAGKSTLLNSLLGEERAIVSPIPGTTRDTIEEVINIKGLAFRIIDTAGIRQTTNEIEAIGVKKAMEQAQKAGLIIYVYDAQKQPIAEVMQEVAALNLPNTHTIVCANKIDLAPVQPVNDAVLGISAQHKTNLEALKGLMVEKIGYNAHSNQILVTNLRHKQALEQAKVALEQALAGLSAWVSGDFLAMDIRHATQQIASITGRIDVEDLLANIFSKFCIGK